MAPLVLVHGVAVSPRYFDPLVAELDVETAAPDLRRHGTLRRQAEALRELVPDGSAVLANSYGCQIVAELARRDPGAVGRAVFVGPTTDPEHRSFVQQGGRLVASALREPPALVGLVLRDALRAGPVRVAQMAWSAVHDRIELELPSFEAPLLVVRGSRDALCPQRWAEEVVRLAPNARLEVVEGAAHAVHFSHPRELAALVHAFLEEAA
jgi:2-hydroxy-6-oxonona-2,4-dienedioate hydrolase